MVTRKVASYLFLACLVVLTVTSCVGSNLEVTVDFSEGDDNQMITTSTEKTNIAELAELINLEYIPVSVVWQVVRLGPEPGDIRLPGPSDAYLVAVLTYTPSVINEIRFATSTRDSDVYVDTDFIKSWYPPSVQAAFITEEKTGFLVLSEPSYDPELFTASPWLTGYVFFPDDETVFLFLRSM